MAEFSFDDLTLDELVAIEEISGVSITELQAVIEDPKAHKAKILKIMGWIVGRRDDPELTYADAGNLPIKSVMGVIKPPAGEEGPPPFASEPMAG